MRWRIGQFAIVLASTLVSQLTLAQAGQAARNQEPSASAQTDKQTTNVQQESGAAVPQNEKPTHKWHVKLGTVSVGAGYTYISNGFYSPFYPFGFFGPSLFYPAYFYGPYDPFFYGNYLPALDYGDDKGKVELAVLPRSADVYVDGAYAGPAGNLKKFWLAPGAYDLAVSMPGGTPFHERIYVLSGKSVKIKRNLMPQNPPEKE